MRREARVLGQLLTSRISGRPAPVWLEVAITSRCNLHCDYCCNGFPAAPDRDLSTPELLAVIDEAARLGTRYVSVSGGEPLLHPELPAILGAIRRRGLLCGLTTNGLLLESKLDLAAGFDFVSVSLDGLGAVNDASRGAGAFARAAAGIRAARARGLRVYVNCQVTGRNRRHLGEFLRWAEGLGLGVRLDLVALGRPGLPPPSDLLLSDDQARTVFSGLHRELRKRRPLHLSARSYQALGEWAHPVSQPFSRLPWQVGTARIACWCGQRAAYVHPTGEVYPCSLAPRGGFQPGNVRDVGLAAAFARTREHQCRSCASTVLLEINGVLGLDPRALLGTAVSAIWPESRRGGG